MGLDIYLCTSAQDNFEFEGSSFSPRLSRTFCFLMGRSGVVDDEPELDQIGRLTGVNVSPIYDMENYREEVDLAEELEFAENEEERQHMQARAAAANARLEGNLDIVYETVTQLLIQLALLTDLPDRLQPTARDTLGRESYFAYFNGDTGEGYIRDNFGQDLRKFKSFLEYAKSKGSRTVFFRYG
jgi:hypothetical protein